MKKLFIGVVVLLLTVSVFAIDQKAFYSDWGVANGKQLDSAEACSVYFQIDNPLLDSVIMYYYQNATTDNPSVSCTLYSTVDPISNMGGGGIGSNLIGRNASKAAWSTGTFVFGDTTVENTMVYKPLTLTTYPGAWYMIKYTAAATEASHDITSRILKAGIITMRKPD